MKIPCNIVQDLLPSYIDELCSEETRKQVGEHLENCQVCGDKYKEMKGELLEEAKVKPVEISVEELLPMKKIRRKHVWQLACLAVVVVAVIIAGGISTVKGSNAGYNKGYTEGTDEGYNTGYSEGTDEGYNTGYTQGYVDATAENPNLLTFQVDTLNVGEMFTQLWYLMQEKWGLDDSVRIVLEEDYVGFAVPDMCGQHFCLSDGKAVYVVESFVGYGENILTIEVKCVEPDTLKIVEESVRFSSFIDCMVAFDLQMDMNYGTKLYTFMFNANEGIKNAPRISVSVDENDAHTQQEWVYESGEAIQCMEDIELEGNGKYFLLYVTGVGYVQNQEGKQNLGVFENYQVYIEME